MNEKIDTKHKTMDLNCRHMRERRMLLCLACSFRVAYPCRSVCLAAKETVSVCCFAPQDIAHFHSSFLLTAPCFLLSGCVCQPSVFVNRLGEGVIGSSPSFKSTNCKASSLFRRECKRFDTDGIVNPYGVVLASIDIAFLMGE